MSALWAAEPTPSPHTITGAVTNDLATRTLIVRRPKDLVGYDAFAWRQAHENLVARAERGWWADINEFRYGRDPFVFCSTVEHRNVVSATPGDNLALKFHFPAGTSEGKVYSGLVGSPRLGAVVTVNRGTNYFLGVLFRHRP